MENNSELLPWMIKFAFWASVILTTLKIWDIASKYFKRPTLDLQLAPEAFFRLSDHGETLFCNPVFIAWNGPLLITGASAVLEKTDNPQKKFPLNIIHYGEKVRGNSVIADHYFHSKSPITYVSESVPQKLVFMCVQGKYADETKRMMNKFEHEILDLKKRSIEKAEQVTDENKFQLRQEILREINKISGINLAALFQLVQLEPGEYKLLIEIEYVDPKVRINRKKYQEASFVTFIVEGSVREQWMDNLRETLYTAAENIIFDTGKTLSYPEYQPVSIKTIT